MTLCGSHDVSNGWRCFNLPLATLILFFPLPSSFFPKAAASIVSLTTPNPPRFQSFHTPLQGRKSCSLGMKFHQEQSWSSIRLLRRPRREWPLLVGREHNYLFGEQLRSTRRLCLSKKYPFSQLDHRYTWPYPMKALSLTFMFLFPSQRKVVFGNWATVFKRKGFVSCTAGFTF